ncbi:MAG: HDOD domain-containing protein [Thiomicrorhabdus chilensis]|uniref:HDOD domain-containing protein n=1 Tax=Thiomicrorhabdus chilensis TaxID=63656 RepID=UPI00299F41AA|nr:HDOD domain-containing protein [Thiomicrorhabdus chilensis]MDX1348515.1 HDOD domain-containing protein [Thiomicrorhabdus chilensis]
MQQKLKRAMGAIQGVKIPDMPKEVLELQQELNHKFPNTQNIVHIIQQNTKLSGEVLRIANSKAMRLKTPATGIKDAVDALGFINLQNLVLAAALKNIFSADSTFTEILEHSIDVAYCAAELSDWVDGISRDQAYLLGLFHNGGAMMLASKLGKDYAKLFSQSLSNPISVIATEEEKLDTNHCMVGVLLGQKWRLPVDMLSAIMLHHNASCSRIQQDRVRAMVAILKISNAIVSEVSLGAYCGQEGRDYLQDGVNELMMDNDVVADIRRGLMTNNVA